LESLAALVASLLFGLIALALLNLGLAVLVRRGKIKRWVGILSTCITGLAAVVAINGSWVLAAAPTISAVAGVLMLLLPKNNQ
jgi:CHASE2 domain-containing sensor protein